MARDEQDYQNTAHSHVEGGLANSAAPGMGQFYQSLGDFIRANGGQLSSIALGKKGSRALQLTTVELKQKLRDLDDLSDEEKAYLAHLHGFHLSRDERTWRMIVIDDGAEGESEGQSITSACDEDISSSKTADRKKREDKTRRMEEARICEKIAPLIQDLYSSVSLSDVKPARAFDVCSGRKGGILQNVDILATQWFGPKEVDIIAIEVKLEFNAEAVMQAMSYSRFADRVWVAFPVMGRETVEDITKKLFDPELEGLFDFAINQGIGILAIPRVQNGGIKKVVPISWPRRQQVDPVARRLFLGRYKEPLIKAKVVRPDEYKDYAY